MRESHLRWFGHVQRRAINAPVRKSELIQVEGTKKGRGRPKITLIEVVKNDMLIKKVTESMTSDRIEWRKRIHVADPD
jgi:hypothetical protein